jgi:branched-chain amino acid transport system permease protein
MTAALFLEQVLNGLMVGAIYALFAAGLALMLGVMDVVNTAHGEFFAIGAYGALGAAVGFGFGPWLYLPCAALLGFACGIVVDIVTLRPLRRRRSVDIHMTSMILTFGVGMVIQNLGLQIIGPKFYKSPEIWPGATELFGMIFINEQLLAAGIALATMAGLALVLRFSGFGRAVRATAQNPAVARLVGIKTDRIATLTFGIGAGLAGIAGALIGPLYFVQPTMGSVILLKGFAVVIVGGMGSVPGAVIGALLLGVAESVGGTVLSYGYKDAIGFMFLGLTLLVRPAGLFGDATRERA